MSTPLSEATGRRLAEAIERLCDLIEERTEPELPGEEPPRRVLPKYGRRRREEGAR